MNDKKIYVPVTFEGLMEVFGINLQRKMLYAKFGAKQKELNRLTKKKEATAEEIEKVAKEVSSLMNELMQICAHDSSSIVNEHN